MKAAAIINRCRRFTSANNENHYYHNETMIPLLPAIALRHCINETKPLFL